MNFGWTLAVGLFLCLCWIVLIVCIVVGILDLTGVM